MAPLSTEYKAQVNWQKKETKGVSVLADEHPGLIQDTCLLIACHESTLSKERVSTFSATIRRAMKLFPASSIFVCDNGNAPHPVDRTQEICDKLSLEMYPDGSDKLQYLYIPEGNKSHAMYWSTEYWIPELVRRGEAIDFSYALIIDDDVPLPYDLHVPLHTLARQREIKVGGGFEVVVMALCVCDTRGVLCFAGCVLCHQGRVRDG